MLDGDRYVIDHVQVSGPGTSCTIKAARRPSSTITPHPAVTSTTRCSCVSSRKRPTPFLKCGGLPTPFAPRGRRQALRPGSEQALCTPRRVLRVHRLATAGSAPIAHPARLVQSPISTARAMGRSSENRFVSQNRLLRVSFSPCEWLGGEAQLGTTLRAVTPAPAEGMALTRLTRG